MHVAESGSGSPLLWVHGFPLSSELFRRQFAIDGVRHIAPDLPGFGRTPAAPWSSVEAAAAMLREELTQRGVSRCVVGGVSMGGYIALALARTAPELVRALILIDTKETADTEEVRQRRMAQIERIEREQSVTFLVDEMLPKMLSPRSLREDEELTTFTRRMMSSTSPAGAISALTAMAGRPDSSDVLRSFPGAVLLLVGGDDPITPPGEAERMKNLSTHGELHVIPGAAHLANLERGDDCNQAIADFLQRLPE